jgi:hypothetical protein
MKRTQELINKEQQHNKKQKLDLSIDEAKIDMDSHTLELKVTFPCDIIPTNQDGILERIIGNDALLVDARRRCFLKGSPFGLLCIGIEPFNGKSRKSWK